MSCFLSISAASILPSITPGTVLILLAGRFRGKRVVFLKQLTSGLLLVTGPFKVNGVPLRRVNQRYVIATSAKVDVAGVDVSKIDDAFFAREKTAPKDADASAPTGTVTSKTRKDAQTKVDSALMKNVDKIDKMGAYLGALFSLSKGDKP